MQEALAGRRERYRVQIRQKKHEEMIIQKRYCILAVMDQVQPTQRIPIKQAVQKLWNSIQTRCKEGALEAVDQIAHCLYPFDSNAAMYLFESNALQALMSMHYEPLRGWTDIESSVHARNRTLFIISRISHMNLTEEIILRLGMVGFVAQQLEMSNLLNLKYVLSGVNQILNFFSNTVCIPGVYAEVCRLSLLQRIIESVRSNMEWYPQLNGFIVWFGCNFLQAANQYGMFLLQNQIIQLEQFALDAINRPISILEGRETSLLDSLQLAILARQLLHQTPNQKYSITALFGIAICRHLTKEHHKRAFALLETITRSSSNMSLQLIQHRDFLHQVLNRGVNQQEHTSYLKIVAGLVTHFKVRPHLKYTVTELSRFLGLVQHPAILDAIFDCLFAYFEAIQYEVSDPADQAILDRMAECTEGPKDFYRLLGFWYNLIRVNGELLVPQYLLDSNEQSDQLSYIQEHAIPW